MRSLLRGLYGITPQRLLDDDRRLTDAVTAALEGGMRLLQYRAKMRSPTDRLRQAGLLKRLCADHDALFIVNDDLDLALASGADGVHLGEQDGSVAEARTRLGDGAIIGASCYNRIDLAEVAAASGASYLAFGRFFPSLSKPQAVQAEPSLLQSARERFDLPLCAIGGITPANAGVLVAAGADLIAVIEGLFGRPDIGAAAGHFSRALRA